MTFSLRLLLSLLQTLLPFLCKNCVFNQFLELWPKPMKKALNCVPKILIDFWGHFYLCKLTWIKQESMLIYEKNCVYVIYTWYGRFFQEKKIAKLKVFVKTLNSEVNFYFYFSKNKILKFYKIWKMVAIFVSKVDVFISVEKCEIKPGVSFDKILFFSIWHIL